MFISFPRDYLQDIHDLLDDLRDRGIPVPEEMLKNLEEIEKTLIAAKNELKALKSK